MGVKMMEYSGGFLFANRNYGDKLVGSFSSGEFPANSPLRTDGAHN